MTAAEEARCLVPWTRGGPGGPHVLRAVTRDGPAPLPDVARDGPGRRGSADAQWMVRSHGGSASSAGRQCTRDPWSHGYPARWPLYTTISPGPGGGRRGCNRGTWGWLGGEFPEARCVTRDTATIRRKPGQDWVGSNKGSKVAQHLGRVYRLKRLQNSWVCNTCTQYAGNRGVKGNVTA
jgi:hypothetical protein